MTKTPIFTGAGTAIITPMNDDFSINYDELGRLLDYQIENQIDSIVICGTTGEASAMDDKEHISVIEYACKHVNKKVPVIAGTGSNDTRHCIHLSQAAKDVGADALLQVTPYYNKTNQKGLVKHFETICSEVGLPVVLYNVPSRTGMSISIDAYKELAENPLIVGTKEASGDISHIAKVAQACGDKLPIYSGNDDQILPIMSLGGIGVISVASNILPKELHNICKLYLDGNVKESQKLQLDLLTLMNSLFIDVNPIPVKVAANLVGWNAGPCRMPLYDMDASKIETLKLELQRYGLI